ncbi:MAG: hypothetical protein ACO38I_03975 [Ilumatobacteraceae bacterium]
MRGRLPASVKSKFRYAVSIPGLSMDIMVGEETAGRLDGVELVPRYPTLLAAVDRRDIVLDVADTGSSQIRVSGPFDHEECMDYMLFENSISMTTISPLPESFHIGLLPTGREVILTFRERHVHLEEFLTSSRFENLTPPEVKAFASDLVGRLRCLVIDWRVYAPITVTSVMVGLDFKPYFDLDFTKSLRLDSASSTTSKKNVLVNMCRFLIVVTTLDVVKSTSKNLRDLVNFILFRPPLAGDTSYDDANPTLEEVGQSLASFFHFDPVVRRKRLPFRDLYLHTLSKIDERFGDRPARYMEHFKVHVVECPTRTITSRIKIRPTDVMTKDDIASFNRRFFSVLPSEAPPSVRAIGWGETPWERVSRVNPKVFTHDLAATRAFRGASFSPSVEKRVGGTLQETYAGVRVGEDVFRILNEWDISFIAGGGYNAVFGIVGTDRVLRVGLPKGAKSYDSCARDIAFGIFVSSFDCICPRTFSFDVARVGSRYIVLSTHARMTPFETFVESDDFAKMTRGEVEVMCGHIVNAIKSLVYTCGAVCLDLKSTNMVVDETKRPFLIDLDADLCSEIEDFSDAQKDALVKVNRFCIAMTAARGGWSSYKNMRLLVTLLLFDLGPDPGAFDDVVEHVVHTKGKETLLEILLYYSKQAGDEYTDFRDFYSRIVSIIEAQLRIKPGVTKYVDVFTAPPVCGTRSSQGSADIVVPHSFARSPETFMSTLFRGLSNTQPRTRVNRTRTVRSRSKSRRTKTIPDTMSLRQLAGGKIVQYPARESQRVKVRHILHLVRKSREQLEFSPTITIPDHRVAVAAAGALYGLFLSRVVSVLPGATFLTPNFMKQHFKKSPGVDVVRDLLAFVASQRREGEVAGTVFETIEIDPSVYAPGLIGLALTVRSTQYVLAVVHRGAALMSEEANFRFRITISGAAHSLKRSVYTFGGGAVLRKKRRSRPSPEYEDFDGDFDGDFDENFEFDKDFDGDFKFDL